jgi:hypothetical protein
MHYGHHTDFAHWKIRYLSASFGLMMDQAERPRACSGSTSIPKNRRLSCLLRLAIVFLALASTQAEAQAPTTAPDTALQTVLQGVGQSYWGIIPPFSDSTAGVASNRALPVWEAALYWPYRVIVFPFRLLGDGIGSGIEFVTETPSLVRLFSFRPTDFYVTPDVNAGASTGIGGGVILNHTSLFYPGNRLRLRVYTSTHNDQRVTFGLRFPLAQGSLDVFAGFRDKSNTRYFGIGPDAVAEDESIYGQRLTWAGASYGRDLGSNVTVVGNVGVSRVATSEPNQDFAPSITDLFAARLPLGFGAATTGVSAGFTLYHDNSGITSRPRTGGIRRIVAAYFHGTSSDDTRYWTYRAELQQFVPLWFKSNVLALRALVTWIEPVGDRAVPFQRLMWNNDPDLLRGFKDYRWRDRGLFVATAEYRWPIWVAKHAEGTGLDSYLLTDVGQVFNQWDQLNGDNMTWSYGAGIRLVTSTSFVFRLEYARATEGGMLRFSGSQVFQSVTRLFGGRDPVPER